MFNSAEQTRAGRPWYARTGVRSALFGFAELFLGFADGLLNLAL
jgi:hypothetical protein